MTQQAQTFSVSDFSEKPVNGDELYDKILSSISDMLKRRFIGGDKTTIRHGNAFFDIACPYCGDSASDETAKRGRMYLNSGSLFFACYNCGKRTPFNKFMQDNMMSEDFTNSESSYMKKSFDISHVHGHGKQSYNMKASDVFDSVEQMGFKKDDLLKKMDLMHAEKSVFCQKYLVEERKQPKSSLKHFAFNPSTKDVYIINMSDKHDVVIGVQIRLNKAKGKQRFHTYPYSELCKIMGKDVEGDPVVPHLNKLSYLYNICNISFRSPCLIFESAIDSNHFQNACAAMGTNNTIKIPNGYLVYDNSSIDKGGRDAAMAAIKDGLNVFLWKKFLKNRPELANKKDFNDIFKAGYNFQSSDLMPYFSNDKLDVFYL